MSQTIAAMLEEKGLQKGIQKGIQKGLEKGTLGTLRETLIMQLRQRFKKLPRKVEASIAATTSIDDLNAWLKNFVDADTLADVRIPTD